MISTPSCDECDGRIRSQIGRRYVDEEYRVCTPCSEKIRTDGLEPGEDFEVGKLWSTEDDDEEGDDDG